MSIDSGKKSTVRKMLHIKTPQMGCFFYSVGADTYCLNHLNARYFRIAATHAPCVLALLSMKSSLSIRRFMTPSICEISVIDKKSTPYFFLILFNADLYAFAVTGALPSCRII